LGYFSKQLNITMELNKELKGLPDSGVREDEEGNGVRESGAGSAQKLDVRA
jgi:hypothetical protein